MSKVAHNRRTSFMNVPCKGYEKKELPALSHKSLCILFNKTAQEKCFWKVTKVTLVMKCLVCLVHDLIFVDNFETGKLFFLKIEPSNFKKWKITSIFIRENLCTEQMVFCYQNCSDLRWERIVLVIEKNFWNLRLKAENFQNFWDHLNNLFKQWKVRTIFGNRMLF